MSYERLKKTRSPLEERFLEDCLTVGLLAEPQYPIGRIHCDFAIPDKKLAIECDSAMHHSTPDALSEDRERDDIYKKEGWTVMRIPGKAIFKCGEYIARKIKSGEYDQEVPGGAIHIFNPCPEYGEKEEDVS